MPELLVTCVKALFGQYAHGTTGPLDEVFGGVTCFFLQNHSLPWIFVKMQIVF